MKKLFLFFSCVILISFNQTVNAQENENHTKDDNNEETEHVEHEGSHKKHAISVVMSHTHIKSGVKNDVGDNWLALPSFGINYNYSFNEKWSLGLHNDIIIEEFIVEDPNKKPENEVLKSEEVEIDGIKRTRPIASAIMLTYKPYKHLALLAGGGMEFSKEESFTVVRIGVEFPFEIPNNWEILGVMAFDININAYDSFTFGIGIAKLF